MIFSIIKSLHILHFSDVHWQVRLTWIKTYLHTRFQIPHDGSLLYETDEISFTTNLAGENPMYAYIFTRYPLSILHRFPKKINLRYYISHVILYSRTMFSQMSDHSSVLHFCATKCWSLFSSKRSLFVKTFHTSEPLKTLGITTYLYCSPRIKELVLSSRMLIIAK